MASSTWPGDAQTPAQIVFGSSDAKLYSVDAKTGKPNEAFGDKGIVNLNTPEILQGLPGRNALSSPPVVYKNLVITGGTTQENPPRGPAGDVRAWDMHTGTLAWTFRSVPRAGEKFNDTWAGDSWKNRSGVNVWGFMTVDVPRGIVYMPFGAPSVDQYGGDREGDNLFGTSLVAADASTGKYLWHFQVVHHDIWDADLAGAPALIDVKHGGRTIPAVAVIGKVGLLFLLDRRNRQADLRRRGTAGGAKRGAAGTNVEDAAVSAEAGAAVAHDDDGSGHRDRHARARSRVPEADRGHAAGRTVPAGGVQPLARAIPRQPWRRQLGWHVVQSATRVSVRQHQRDGADYRTEGSRSERRPARRAATVSGTVSTRAARIRACRVAAASRTTTRTCICQQPPWGQLTAVNVNTGEFAWRVPLGITESLPPDKQKTGRPGNGGTIATAGGLVFVGATDDSRFRAFDAKSGKELWTYKLPGAAQATPMTYEGRDGRQYVVITATGGSFFGNPVTGDSVIAFALTPRTASPPGQRPDRR